VGQRMTATVTEDTLVAVELASAWGQMISAGVLTFHPQEIEEKMIYLIISDHFRGDRGIECIIRYQSIRAFPSTVQTNQNENLLSASVFILGAPPTVCKASTPSDEKARFLLSGVPANIYRERFARGRTETTTA